MTEISLDAGELTEISTLLIFLEGLEDLSVGPIAVFNDDVELGRITSLNGSYFFDYGEADAEEELPAQRHSGDVLGEDGDLTPGDSISPLDHRRMDALDRCVKGAREIEATHSWIYGQFNVTCAICHCRKGDEAARKPCRMVNF